MPPRALAGHGDDRRLPAYAEGRCFSALPGRLEELVAAHDRVVLVYFDAFGWRFFERHSGHPLFRDAQAERWTSQFPSTTAVHSTTINTGLPVAQHGLYEWFVREPKLNRLIAPLPFSLAGDAEPDTLLAAGLEAEDVFPFETLYRRLGVPSFAASPALISFSTASRRLTDGATPVPFDEPADGARLLAEAIAAEERAYGTIYLPRLDAVMHIDGPDAASTGPVIEETLAALEAAPWPEGTLMLLTADHGCTAISPARTTYVNVVVARAGTAPGAGRRREAARARRLVRAISSSTSCPTGSTRRRRGSRSCSRARPTVERVDALVAAGVFGPDPSDGLRARLANLVVLPYAGEAVYWLEAGRFEQKFLGQHGGLSPDEMDIPLVSWTAR